MMPVSTIAVQRPDPIRVQQSVEPRRLVPESTKAKKDEPLEPKELDIDNLPCTD